MKKNKYKAVSDVDEQLLQQCIDIARSVNQQRLTLDALQIKLKKTENKYYSGQLKLSIKETDRVKQIIAETKATKRIQVINYYHECKQCRFWQYQKCYHGSLFSPRLAVVIKSILFDTKTKCPYKEEPIKIEDKKYFQDRYSKQFS